MSTDRFGNAYAPGLPYARGHILPSTEDDFRKLQEAWRILPHVFAPVVQRLFSIFRPRARLAAQLGRAAHCQ